MNFWSIMNNADDGAKRWVIGGDRQRLMKALNRTGIEVLSPDMTMDHSCRGE